VAQTSARVEGTVNPQGSQSTYAFELGVYEGMATQYDIVASGSTGTGTVAEPETVTLTGLQPGKTYAYRISVGNGDIANETHTLQGAMATFTTAGAPVLLSSPPTVALLPVPAVSIPREPAAKVTAKKLTRAQQLANALKACAHKPKTKRSMCKRAAEQKYGADKTKQKAKAKKK
jgi:hypothetical protein